MTKENERIIDLEEIKMLDRVINIAIIKENNKKIEE